VVLLLVALLAVVAACGEESDGGGASGEPSDCNTDEVETDEGLIYQDTECGSGAEAEQGSTLLVHYTGKLEDGTKFDSSLDRGEPIPFVLGAGDVIAGWDIGFEGMKVGGKRTLTIPPELGYGEAGYPPTIPPNATLVFDVELVEVQTSEG
jgi:peptidylprolyl isomerase